MGNIVNIKTNEVIFNTPYQDQAGLIAYNLSNEWRLATDQEVATYQAQQQIITNNASIQAQIDALDLKRIRAIAEPATNPLTGNTYLVDYTNQIQSLRSQIVKISQPVAPVEPVVIDLPPTIQLNDTIS